jgi:hypothetical protein
MDRNRLISAVDRVPELQGVGIAFIGDRQCTMVRESDHSSGFRTYVVFQEVETFAPFAPLFSSAGAITVTPSNPPQLPSTVGAELKSMALNCGGVVLSACLAGGSAVAIPVSAGFSSVTLALASSAFIATSLRCGMSVGRLINAQWMDPQLNQVIDKSDWYPTVSTIIEAIDVADAARSGLTTIAKYKALRKATSKPMVELLQGATRPERKRIAEEMAKFTGEAPSRRAFLKLARAGKLPKLYEVKEIRKEIVKGLLEAAQSGKTMADGLLPGDKKNKPGIVNELVLHVMQEN